MSNTSSFAEGLGFINNPDRYPSIGLSLGMTDIDGDDVQTLDALASTANATQKTQDLTIDLRLPVSHELTLFGAFSVISQTVTTDSRFPFQGQNQELDGFGFRIGARYYFNR